MIENSASGGVQAGLRNAAYQAAALSDMPGDASEPMKPASALSASSRTSARQRRGSRRSDTRWSTITGRIIEGRMASLAARVATQRRYRWTGSSRIRASRVGTPAPFVTIAARSASTYATARHAHGACGADTRTQTRLELFQGPARIARRGCGDRVARHDQAVLALMRLARRHPDAAVGGNAGKDEGAHAQELEQQLQRRAVEARVTWLEHEVVALLRGDAPHELAARRSGGGAARDQVTRVAAPAAEVVVHVHDGNGVAPGLVQQRDHAVLDALHLTPHARAVRKREVVDQVDDEECRAPPGGARRPSIDPPALRHPCAAHSGYSRRKAWGSSWCLRSSL